MQDKTKGDISMIGFFKFLWIFIVLMAVAASLLAANEDEYIEALDR